MMLPPGSRPGPGPDPESRLSSLLLEMSRGDRAAFAEAYDRLAPPLFQIARGRDLDEDTAAAIVERTLLRVWRDAPHVMRREASALAWLLGVIHEALVAAQDREMEP